jgi:predicted signal transduction protein with EAL and GGDEF domain
VDATLGVALIPRDGEEAEALLRAVDVALRVAKRSGRHQLSVYAGESFSDHGPDGAREALERLIGGDGLGVVVQPIVSVSAGTPHAFEALARFQTRGTSSPPRSHACWRSGCASPSTTWAPGTRGCARSPPCDPAT